MKMHCSYFVTSSLVIMLIQLLQIVATVPHEQNRPPASVAATLSALEHLLLLQPAAATAAGVETLRLPDRVNNDEGGSSGSSGVPGESSYSRHVSDFIPMTHSRQHAAVAAARTFGLPRRPRAPHHTSHLTRTRRAGQVNGNGNTGRSSAGSRRKGQRTTTTTETTPSEPFVDISSTTSWAIEDDSSTIMDAIQTEMSVEDKVGSERVEAVIISQDKPQNIFSDWMWTASYMNLNTEKLALHSMLSVACGSVAILMVIVVLLRCRRHKRGPAESSGNGSRDALNATGSGNVYTPSPASSDVNRHVVSEGGGGSWWSRDDEAKSQSGSLNHPSAATTATVSRRFPATSGNGWMTSESDAASLEMCGNTSTSQVNGLSTANGRDRSGRIIRQDTDEEFLMIRSERPSADAGYSAGQAEIDVGGPWCNNGGVVTNADGAVGTLGRSFTNPYRHDSYRNDGMRTMQFK